MTTIREITDFMRELAPLSLAEEWDNVGLLMGDDGGAVERVMTCLTLTPDTVQEACDRQADLVISHHPLPFRAIRRITTQSYAGRLIWQLASRGIAVFSAHTAFDSSPSGINQQIAEALGLSDIIALRPAAVESGVAGGGGRMGRFAEPQTVCQLIDRVKSVFGIDRLTYVARAAGGVEQVAIACGAADEFLADAIDQGCQAFITGESRFHTLLEAQAHDVCVVLPGHFASERFAMQRLAAELASTFEHLEVWAAQEQDPLMFG